MKVLALLWAAVLHCFLTACTSATQLSYTKGFCGIVQVIEFRWAQLVFDRFMARDLAFLGSEYLPCGHLPSRSALMFVENHDRQSNCHVADPEAPCASLTAKDGDIYKVAG